MNGSHRRISRRRDWFSGLALGSAGSGWELIPTNVYCRMYIGAALELRPGCFLQDSVEKACVRIQLGEGPLRKFMNLPPTTEYK